MFMERSRVEVCDRVVANVLHDRGYWFRDLRHKPILKPADVKTSHRMCPAIRMQLTTFSASHPKTCAISSAYEESRSCTVAAWIPACATHPKKAAAPSTQHVETSPAAFILALKSLMTLK